jgi:hypothetical protein
MIREAGQDGSDEITYSEFSDIMSRYRDQGGSFLGWGRLLSFKFQGSQKIIDETINTLFKKLETDEVLGHRFAD